jgi:protoporphyrinogen oxidase
MPKVVIIGAGLTGLSLAYHLEKNNFFDYQIFEKDSRAGGLLKSVTKNGFTFDHTGHFLHISNRDFENFLQEVLGLEQMNMLNRQSFIYSQGVYTAYPFQKNLFGLPKEVIIECIEGFVNRRQSIKKVKNFYEWVQKYFGLGLGKHFFFPYNTKLLNIPPKKLMPSWTSRFVPSTSLKELLEGALEKKAVSLDGYNSSFFYPKTGGIETLIKAIIAKLKTKILTNFAATNINQRAKTVQFTNGQTTSFEQLFSTAPLPELLTSLAGDSSSTLAQAAQKLQSNQVINFNLGINRPNISEKHWVYFPEKQFPLYRLGFWHNFSGQMAPLKKSSCYGEVSVKTGAYSQSAQKKFEQNAIKKTLNFLNLSPTTVVEQETLHLKYAYVTYDDWREKNLEKVHQELERMSIYSIGRFGRWKYSSMQEAVLDGIFYAKLATDK